jgi:transposase
LDAHQKKVARRHAHLIFIDETGFLMHPLLRRTWAPVGRTPLVCQRTRMYRKVSCIGGLSISPRRRRLQWYLKFHTDTSIRQPQVIAFLHHLLRQIRGVVVVVWDRLLAHRGGEVRRWAQRHPRLTLEYLPPYAPELNPNEYGWGYLKNNELANYGPAELKELEHRVRRACRSASRRCDLLKAFVRATGLSLRFA